MPAADAIDRLAREELTSPAYRELAAARFGDNAEAHVRYVQWLFDENPASWRDEPLPIFVCRDGQQLIGQVAVIPVDLQLNGTPVRGGWYIDTFVLPAYQRQRVGERLIRVVDRHVPLSLSLGQSDAAFRLLQRLDWCVAGAMTRYRRVLRPLHATAKKALEMLGLGNLARMLPRAHIAREGSTPPAIRVEPVTSFAHIVDQHSDLRGPGAGATRVGRTAAFMQWRYCANPFFQYAVRRLSIAGYGDAYAVCRLSDEGVLRRTVLVDLVYPDGLPQALLADVVTVVVDAIGDDGAEIFECQTSDTAVLAALGASPLSRAQPGMRFLYRATANGTAGISTVDSWRLYVGDSDADTYMARRVQR